MILIVCVVLVSSITTYFLMSSSYQQQMSNNQDINTRPVATIDPSIDSNYKKRQIDISEYFIESEKYPVEVSLQSEDLLTEMVCSEKYFSWEDLGSEITNVALQTYLRSAEAISGKGQIRSLQACSTPDGRTLVIYNAGPFGGGSNGIPVVAFREPSGDLKQIARLLPLDEGAYYSCVPLQLSKYNDFYLKCWGENGAAVRVVNLDSGEQTTIISCAYDLNPKIVCKKS